MRTKNGFSTRFFALALMALAVSFAPAVATAQTVPVANGYNLRLITRILYSDFVAADGYDGFCPLYAAGSEAEYDLLLPSGEPFLLANQKLSFNSGNGGERVFFHTMRNGLSRGGHACGVNDFLFFTFTAKSAATIWDLRLGDAPTYGNYRKFVAPGDTWNYVGGSATYLDCYNMAANYGRTILTCSFDRGFGAHTMVFELFAGAPPRLLADIGTDEAIATTITANMVYVQTINADHTEQSIVAVPKNGQQFTVATLGGFSNNDLVAPTYSSRELAMAASRNTAVWSIRLQDHLVIQKLADGQTTPLTILDTNQVQQYPVAPVNSIAITDAGEVYFTMQTLIPADQNYPHGGDNSIFVITSTGLVRVMTEALDFYRLGPAWAVYAANGRVLASRWFETWEILPPK